MQVTEVKVFPVNEERLKAYVTITFDACFVVRDVKIIDGNSGLFVAMPAKKRKDGTFKDMAHPLNMETREMIESRVLAEYAAEIKRQPVRAHGADRMVDDGALDDLDLVTERAERKVDNRPVLN
ncbi:MAG: septation regulator SpoVG [Deltaproteobacteria bacterium]|nr:septation regulator SpoVG [Deltaproteobacteria bacterium]